MYVQKRHTTNIYDVEEDEGDNITEDVPHDDITVDADYEGLQVVEAPTHHVEYDPPEYYQLIENDIRLEADLQLAGDAGSYNTEAPVDTGSHNIDTQDDDDSTYSYASDEEEVFQLNDVEARIDAAFDEAAENWEYNNLNYDSLWLEVMGSSESVRRMDVASASSIGIYQDDLVIAGRVEVEHEDDDDDTPEVVSAVDPA